MSKALEIDSSRRSLLKYTVAGLLAGFGGRLLPHVSSAYAATEGGAKALVVYYSRSGNTRAVAEAIHAAVGGDIVELQSVTPTTLKISVPKKEIMVKYSAMKQSI